MTKIVQEKFQVNYADKQSSAENQTSWVTDAEARAKKNTPGREGRAGGDSSSRFMNNAACFNTLPPGMDIEDQEMCDIRRMEIVDGSGYNQVTQEMDRRVNPQTVRTGFQRLKLLSTDDAYTREHNDAFYDVVEVDGKEGFVERNNMLDRL